MHLLCRVAEAAWRERKERYLDHLKDAQDGAVLVSLADKLDNVRAIRRDLEHDGAKVWDRLSVPAPGAHLWYHRSLLEIYKQRSDSWMVDELEGEVERLAAWSEAAGSFRQIAWPQSRRRSLRRAPGSSVPTRIQDGASGGDD